MRSPWWTLRFRCNPTGFLLGLRYRTVSVIRTITKDEAGEPAYRVLPSITATQASPGNICRPKKIKMEKLLELFSRFATLEPAIWKKFQQYLKPVRYRRGETIHQPRVVQNNTGFILDGIARSYLQKRNGKDITWFFHYYHEEATAKQFMLIDYPNFFLQQPAIYGFQALTDCEVVLLSFEAVGQLMPKIEDSVSIEKKLVISAYAHNNERMKSLLTATATERLAEFEQEHGFLFDKIPHYYIASYLGITPQRLSQLRQKRQKTR